MQTKDTQPIAAAAYSQFETATRDDGSRFTKLRDGAPEWIKDAIKEAHDGKLPDDWTYGVCREAFEWLADNAGDPDDLRAEFADDADIYDTDLLAWFGSHSARQSYVEQARDEGLVASDDGITRQIMYGQYIERGIIFQAVAQACEDRADDLEDDDFDAALGEGRR